MIFKNCRFKLLGKYNLEKLYIIWEELLKKNIWSKVFSMSIFRQEKIIFWNMELNIHWIGSRIHLLLEYWIKEIVKFFSCITIMVFLSIFTNFGTFQKWSCHHYEDNWL